MTSRWRPYCRKSTFGFSSGNDTRFERLKSTRLPNFYDVFQSTAEINYFRFRKTDVRQIGILFPVSILLMDSHRHVILFLVDGGRVIHF